MLHNFIINMRSQDAHRYMYTTYVQKLSLTVQFQNPNIFYIYSYIFSEYYCYQTKHQPSPLLHCPCRHHGPRHQCNVSRAVMRSSNNLLRVKIVSYGHLASASDVILVTCVFCVMPQATTNN